MSSARVRFPSVVIFASSRAEMGFGRAKMGFGGVEMGFGGVKMGFGRWDGKIHENWCQNWPNKLEKFGLSNN